MRDGSLTKEKIDSTAMRLFVEKGITETTIRDIATAAGIAEGTLYRHYASKEELSWQLFVSNFTAIGAKLNELQKEQDSTRAKLDTIIRYFCSVFERDAVTFNYLFLVRHQHMLRLNPRQPNPYLVFRTVIRDGITHGEIPKQDLDVATSMVMGIILQVIDARILGGRITQQIETLADTLIQASYRVLDM